MILLATGGCTRFGSNDSGEETTRQLQLVIQEIEDSYVEAHRVNDVFSSVAPGDACISANGQRFGSVLREHGILAASVSAGALEPPPGYRAQARLFRAVNGARRALMSDYERVKRRITKCEANGVSIISAMDRMLEVQW